MKAGSDVQFAKADHNTKKIFITTTWTCIRRKLDAQRYANYFVKNNHEIVNDPRKADVILLVTCADTNSRTEQALKEAKKLMNYNAELIVAGCLPLIDKEKLEEIFNGKTVATKEMEKIDKLFPEHNIKLHEIPDATIPWQAVDESKTFSAFKEQMKKLKLVNKINKIFTDTIRKSSVGSNALLSYYATSVEKPYFIVPSRGCLGKCAYCAINKAIGTMHSKPLDELVSDFKRGLNHGYKNFVIDADDLGCYGIDVGSNIPQLLNKIISTPGDYRLDLHFIHPQWVIKYIDELEEILKSGKIYRIGSSIQAGNPRILKLMHRYSDIEKIKETFLRLKKAYPPLLLETEIIVGFPSETFEEFLDSLRIIEEVRFGWGVIYPFSCKTRTEAENINPKNSQEEILKRIKYAKKYLRKRKYDVQYAKYFRKLSQNILVYSDVGSMPNPMRTK